MQPFACGRQMSWNENQDPDFLAGPAQSRDFKNDLMAAKNGAV
jgi:hypothetical protein